MSGSGAHEGLPWRRRPRRPLPALLHDWRVWPGLVILELVALFAGGVYAATPGPWLGRALGGVSFLVGVAAPVWFVLYSRRPVVDDRLDPDAPWVTTEIAKWREEMARTGRVEIGLSPRKLLGVGVLLLVILGFSLALLLGASDVVGRVIGGLCLVVLVPFGLVPQLEFATARGPALRIDGVGIRIARWRPVEVPWTELVAADVRAPGQSSSSQFTILYVTPEWYASYQERRPFVRRATDRIGARSMGGPSFSIPMTVDAAAFPLSLWLDDEITRRNPSVRPDDQEAG